MIISNQTELRTDRSNLEILTENLNHALVRRNLATEHIKSLRHQIKKEREKLRLKN